MVPPESASRAAEFAWRVVGFRIGREVRTTHQPEPHDDDGSTSPARWRLLLAGPQLRRGDPRVAPRSRGLQGPRGRGRVARRAWRGAQAAGVPGVARRAIACRGE